jgi:hypothetical protein
MQAEIHRPTPRERRKIIKITKIVREIFELQKVTKRGNCVN